MCMQNVNLLEVQLPYLNLRMSVGPVGKILKLSNDAYLGRRDDQPAEGSLPGENVEVTGPLRQQDHEGVWASPQVIGYTRCLRNKL